MVLKNLTRYLRQDFRRSKIGLIPQTNDCVVIGDIERTRLDNIKVMFFVGIHDGNVPKKSDSRSVLSESDREYLEDKGIVMSASVRGESIYTEILSVSYYDKECGEALHVICGKKQRGCSADAFIYYKKHEKNVFTLP